MSFIELYSWAVWDAFSPRKLIGMFLLALVAPAFGAIIFLADRDINPIATYSIVVQMGVYSFAVVLMCVIHGAGMISNEVLNKTIPFLITRPIPRTRIFFAKWLAASTLVTFTGWLSAFLLAIILAGNSIANTQLSRDLLIIPIAALVYCAVFGALSALLTRPVLPAVIYIFGVESWVWLMPGDMQKLSLMSHVRTIAHHTPHRGGETGVAELLGLLNPKVITETTAWNTLILVLILGLVVGSIAFSRGEYVPKEETN
jgi:hypothetical protein